MGVGAASWGGDHRVTIEPSFSRSTLEAFSGALLKLDQLAADASPAQLMREGLSGLRTLVPFDAAWWGETSGGINGLAPRNWLSGCINLSDDFAREWNRISSEDRFANDSMRMLGVVVFQSGYADPEPTVEAFARRHDLFHLMAITRALPGSGLLQFVSLYRHRRSPEFDPAHRVLFEQFSAHLMQRWSARIAVLLAGGDPRRHGSAAGAADEHGLVDASGDFVYVGARLALLLRERFAKWDGTHLPEDLTQAVRQAPAVLKLGRRRLSTQRCGELVLLSVAPQRRMALLPPRELSVALLYADGRSHKQIARETGLTPSTVRTYLREAYLRLGVSDKVALGRALAPQKPRRRSA